MRILTSIAAAALILPAAAMAQTTGGTAGGTMGGTMGGGTTGGTMGGTMGGGTTGGADGETVTADHGTLEWPRLPAGLPDQLRTRLEPVLGVRALLPVVQVSGSSVSGRLLDAQGKTMLRLVHERPATISASRSRFSMSWLPDSTSTSCCRNLRNEGCSAFAWSNTGWTGCAAAASESARPATSVAARLTSPSPARSP